MALPPTIYTFEVELSDVDRNVYETLERRMKLAVSVTGGQLYVTVDDRVIEGAVERHAVG